MSRLPLSDAAQDNPDRTWVLAADADGQAMAWATALRRAVAEQQAHAQAMPLCARMQQLLHTEMVI